VVGILACAQPQAQTSPSRFRGKVLDSTGAAIAGARITAIPEPRATANSTWSDAGGVFSLELDPATTYTLKIAADVGGKTLSAEHRFEIVRRDLESMEMLANFDLLRQRVLRAN
jgi:hypothetical protein